MQTKRNSKEKENFIIFNGRKRESSNKLSDLFIVFVASILCIGSSSTSLDLESSSYIFAQDKTQLLDLIKLLPSTKEPNSNSNQNA